LTTELHIVAATAAIAAISNTTMMKYLFPLILLCAGFISVESFTRPHRCFRQKVRVELKKSEPLDSPSLANKVDEIEKNVHVIYKKLNATQIEIKEVLEKFMSERRNIETTRTELAGNIATARTELAGNIEMIRTELATTKTELAGSIETTRTELATTKTQLSEKLETTKTLSYLIFFMALGNYIAYTK
jgi:vacuolar-type H+-ATPase subunit I/STV1